MGKYKKDFKGLKDKEVLDLAWLFYRSGVEDQIYVGNFITVFRSDVLNASNVAFFDKALDYFHTWGTIDDFCVHTMEVLLGKFPKQAIALLKKWNRSKNMWKRRASVVAFTRKAGESGKFTEIALKLCNNLANDDEDLVRKGVGWALKDVMRGDRSKVLGFVKGLRKRNISAVITLYALRDIKGLEREKILKMEKIE
jgi:3-methyladenine DNA glycosylase AlkD